MKLVNKLLKQNHRFLIIYLIPLFLILLNVYLKFKHITNESICIDEPFSIYYSQYDLSSIISFLSKGNNPPLFEIILHFWIKFFGIGEFSVRFLPCLFSCLTVFFIYRIGLDFYNLKVGLFSSLFFSLSNYQMYFAHEARVYSLLMLLSCISIYLFMKCLKKPKIIFSIALGITNLLIIYSHFFGFFILFIELLIVLANSKNRKLFLKSFLIIHLGVLLGYLPYLNILLDRFLISTSEGTWVQPVSNLGPLHDFIFTLFNKNTTSNYILLIVLWLGYQNFVVSNIKNHLLKTILSILSTFYLFYSISLVGPMSNFWEFNGLKNYVFSYLAFIVVSITISFLSKNNSKYQKYIIIWFFIPLLIMFIASFKIPMFIERYLIFISPAFYILLGAVVYSLQRKTQFPFSYLVLGLMWLMLETNVSKHREVKQLVSKVKEIEKDNENTLILLCPDYFDLNFIYYYDRDLFTVKNTNKIYTPLQDTLKLKNIYPIRSIKEVDKSILKKFDKIIYIDAAADFNYPNNKIFEGLNKEFSSSTMYEFPEIFKVYEFEP